VVHPVRFLRGTSDIIGIGLALANDLSQKGWKLAIVDMNSEDGEAAVANFGKGNAIFIKADVSKWEENVRFFKETKEAFGRIDFGLHHLPASLRGFSGRKCWNRRYSRLSGSVRWRHKTELEDN